MIKKFLLAIIFGLFLSISFAQIPAGYYDSATGTGYTLKTQLYNKIKDHTPRDYGDLWTDFYSTDRKDNDSVWCMYSDVPGGTPFYEFTFYVDQDAGSGGAVEGDKYNREHSFPKSWFADGYPMYTDLYHLYPTDKLVNNKRNNFPFGEVGLASWTSLNGSKLGVCEYSGYTGTVFEPIDEYKGDFARTYFYMATRYQDVIAGWETNDSNGDAVLDGTSDHVYEDWYLNMIIEWHNNDPVSQKEIDRNNAVFTIQNNRNPFIDHPEYVAQIWGGEGVFISNISQSPENPASSDDVTVTATITSSGGTITSANLKWGTSTGTYPNTVAMTNSGDTYSGIIPLQANGTNVFYIIEAEDDNAETASSSEYNYTVNDNAATIIMEEDFSSCPASGWITYSAASNKDWTCGSGYESINAFSGDVASDDWLITPAQNLDFYENEVLTFTSWTQYYDTNYPSVELKYSTDYSGSGNPAAANWTNLTVKWAAENSQVSTSSGDIDLSGISGNSVYFAFHYISTGMASGSAALWRVDDLLITGEETTAGVPQITGIGNTPISPTDEESVTVSATITDDGTISTAEIKWGTESGSYPNSVSMTNSADVYSGDIPAQTSGTTVYYVIEATDNDSETNRSDENSYTVVLNELPQITNVSHLPSTPTEGDDVVVSATITDSDGTISSTSLKWGTSTGVYPNEINMTVSSANTYISDSNIPAQQDGTVVYFVLKAEDNEAGIKTSSEFNYTVVDPVNQAPVISDVVMNPESPTENDNVTISAEATDPDGSIESVILKWKIDEGSFTDISMNLSGGKYYGQIPKQAIGLTVYFKVLATDNEGLEGSIDDHYTVSQSSGIGDFNYEMDLLLYPNPVKEYLTIQLGNFTGIVELNIYDVIGVPVVSQKLDFSNEYKIAINNLESGLYLVSFVIDNVLITKRIVVKK